MIARWFAGLALLLPAAPPPLVVAQAPATDTASTVQGFVQEDPTTGAITIVTPLPVTAFEHSSYVVKLTTRTDKWSRFNGQFVEASGRLGRDPAGALLLAADAMKSVDPPGTAHRVYNSGYTVRVKLALSVIPNRFAWLQDGRSTGVNPTVVYTIRNTRSDPMIIVLQTDDLVCMSVQQAGITIWDSTTLAPRPNHRRFVFQHGGDFRELFQLPRRAAPGPGRYTLRIGICQVDDYDMALDFVVQ
jgi:hypothetical protein